MTAKHTANDCLSFGDALFLHLERDGMPLHVASLCMYEGEISLDLCIRNIQWRLAQIPRYLQRVVPPPFGLGIPVWEFDPNFDIANHIREVKLKHGTDAELKSVVSRILSVRMPRTQPLWDVTLISGLRGHRTAMLTRVHHCLADGISGVELLKAIMDESPVPKPIPRAKRLVPEAHSQNQAALLLDGMVTTWFSAVERILTAGSEVLQFAQDFAAAQVVTNGNGNGNGHAAGMNIAGLAPELGSPTERLPFNVVCKGPQKYRWTEIGFHDIRAIKRACDATVNDVVLTMVAMAVRQYLQAKGISTVRRVLRIVVPVSIRQKTDAQEWGNQITFVPVTIPLGVKSARKMLEAVHERMGVIKGLRVAEVVALLGTVLGTIPTAVQTVAGPVASQLPLSLCNLICTNVPGPQEPLYFHGHKMLTCYPYVPIGGEMGMNVAVLTYNGTAFFGFTGDVNAIADIDALPKALKASFEELKKVAGVRAERKQKVKTKKVKKAAPVVAEVPKEEVAEPEKVMAATA